MKYLFLVIIDFVISMLIALDNVLIAVNVFTMGLILGLILFILIELYGGKD